MKTLITLFIMTLTFNAFSQDVSENMDSLTSARVEVESSINQKPYQKAQQEIFRTYFTKLKEFVSEVKESEYLTEQFNNLVLKMGVNNICKNILIDNTSWKDLVKNCTKNRFFLCSEEIKFYNDYKAGLKELMYQDLKSEFARSNNCNF